MTFRRTRCAHCRAKLTPERPSQIVHAECAESYAIAKREKEERSQAKAARMAAKVEKAETRRRKEAIKTIPQLTREAQLAFNAYIRARDQAAGHDCISSGRPLDWSGNAVDAGHYRSTGAAPHLRFNEDNCHTQSKHDNRFLAGNVIEYRIRLLDRIGLARVEALEANNEIRKWTREELIAIRNEYRAKAKQLKKESQQ
ncbi:MAG: ninG protein [Pseudomonas sp.]|uniref:recombination protein NinG n=1 Tax=Pseudomonas sp. TaxID=306 RepID=UPI001D672AA0|nr:recombination protein NinG [Pseudomonas sp.]MPS99529.1 ninG protein [Pseudomonas sp.]